MSIEEAFDVTLPDTPPNLAYKQVFTRNPFRLRDLAEGVYMQQGCGRIPRKGVLGRTIDYLPARSVVPFLQLGGRLPPERYHDGPLHSPVGNNDEGFAVTRRSTDGMICVHVPAAADVVIGDDDGNPDERPAHRTRVDAFLIDQEPVSTTAYCRFLNSIGPVDPATLELWFVLPPADQRRAHELVRLDGSAWSPLPGTERFPMMLVSWYGAAAYARWANRRDWRALDEDDDDAGDCLPTEAQWEYAARGTEPRRFPWGDDEPTSSRMRFARHRRGVRYRADTLPLADVNEHLGLSPFGLTHMAGNVWQWCRDWYNPDAYTAAASGGSPRQPPTGIRSERGGSWIGPASLCRSAYRRGRVPTAKGRCLGFRCIGHRI